MHTSVYIIAEAGVNHDGDEDKARSLVDIAAEAGANAVKFQLFDPDALVTATAPTADYQAKNLMDDRISQRDMLRRLTLPLSAYTTLSDYCRARGIDFLCTPFDHGSLHYLVEHTQMRALKLASGEVTNGPLLLAAARTGLPVILSTGMSDMREIEEALAVLHFGYTHKEGHPKSLALDDAARDALRGKVTLMHCVSQYPAPASATNLRAMDTMAKKFHLPVGLSDHSLGIHVTLAAVARGAAVIEKHFTHDVKANGPDHAASLPPEMLSEMVTAIHDIMDDEKKRCQVAETNIHDVMGDGEKRCQEAETNTKTIARRSVVAACAIAKGEAFTQDNLICKRPATGPLAPMRLWDLLGKKAVRAYAADEFIDAGELA